MVSVSTSTSTYQYQKMFSKMDANQDGTVSQDEFSSNRPKDVSEAQSSTLYGKLNSSGTGAMTYDEYVAGSESTVSTDSTTSKSSGEIMAMLMDMWQQTQSAAQPEQPSSDDAFSKLDVDGDGSVTQAEFLAGKPDDVTEEQATALFASLDTESTGSVTAEQFAAGMEKQRPDGPGLGMMPPPPPQDTASTLSTDDTTDTTTSTSADDLLNQLLQALQAYKDNSADETAADALLAA